MSSHYLSFEAHIIQGEGKGRAIGSPTINIDPEEIPSTLYHGIYAARMGNHNGMHNAVIHFGPRLFHELPVSFEIHLLMEEKQNMKSENANLPIRQTGKHAIQNAQVGDSVLVEIVKRIRNIQNFKTEAKLKAQIKNDIDKAKSILKTLSPPNKTL